MRALLLLFLISLTLQNIGCAKSDDDDGAKSEDRQDQNRDFDRDTDMETKVIYGKPLIFDDKKIAKMSYDGLAAAIEEGVREI